MKYSSSRALHIGLVTWDYDPPVGGLGRALQEIVDALRESGVHVHVYTDHRRWFLSRFIFSLNLLWKLSRWVDQQRIDILLLPTGPGGLFLLRKPEHCRCIVLSYHTYVQQARYVPGEWWKVLFVPLEQRTLRTADVVFCYCEDTQRVLQQEYGVEEVRLLPQILNIERWMNKNMLVSHQKNLCLFIGRPDRRKGISVLQQAWKKVSACLPDAQLKIVSHGDLSQATLISLVQSADLVICPSYIEGFGLVIAEAMAAGTPVIACDSDGVRCLIRHHETGWLVPRGDAGALADGIIRLLRDEPIRRRLADAAQREITLRFERTKSVSVLLEKLSEVTFYFSPLPSPPHPPYPCRSSCSHDSEARRTGLANGGMGRREGYLWPLHSSRRGIRRKAHPHPTLNATGT